MANRQCPFCFSTSGRVFGVRGGVWIKCKECGSIFQDITVEQFEQLHHEAWQTHAFVNSAVAVSGLEPARALWAELSLPGTSLLEIGPGSGHLLAAARDAGRTVAAIETSEINRNFIRKTWGIGSLYADIADVPADRSFDAIIMINVLEHVYDIAGFLAVTSKLLSKTGVIFISTVNGVSLEAAVLGSWWAMCKQHDHVSFPSPEGLSRVALAADLRPERIWSGELPFEFPISVLVAARDWAQARHHPGADLGHDHSVEELPDAADLSRKARLARFYSASGRFDPTARLLGALGRAATVKARLHRVG